MTMTWTDVGTNQRIRIGAGLFLLTLLTRIPFATAFLFHWDSVNYALALQQFNIYQDQPQLPGYILYVALGKVINYFVANANVTYVGLSIVSSAVAVLVLYVLASEMFDETVGLWASLFLLTSPLFWFNGEIALPYCLDLAF